MGEMIILLNDVMDGIRRLHMMSDAPIPDPSPISKDRNRGREIEGIEIPEGVQVQKYQDEIRLFHLEAIWVPRGDLVRFERRMACGADCPICHGKGCTWHLQLTLFMLEEDETFIHAIAEAAVEYALRTGNDPQYAWMRSLPEKVRYGGQIPLGYPGLYVNLFSAAWMPERAVAVGRGNS